ncbi:hypothetical protein BY458DRAFT_560077 [Sporodiniella umbellata]|nr:hypothetical protein BY458DRAFT_560077 [Sporodiniella umbellata]
MNDISKPKEFAHDQAIERSREAPNIPEHCNPSLLKLMNVYEKRLLQSSIGAEFQPTYSSIYSVDLEEGIVRLERTVQNKLVAYIENKKRQETMAQQHLETLDKEIAKLKLEEEQQKRSYLALENTLGSFNRQYELHDKLDVELDELAVAAEALASVLETNPKKVHGVLLSNIVLSSVPYFGKEVTTLQRLFMDAEKNQWSQLFGKQIGKCQEQCRTDCSEETITQFKKLLAEQGLHCTEKEEMEIRNCIHKAIQLKRFYVAGYPDLISKAKTLHENRWKSGRSEKNTTGGWVRKLKKLTEK